MNDFRVSRRQLLKSTAAATLGWTVLTRTAPGAPTEDLPPVRTITHGPQHHWFGYYDKLQFDRDVRYVLGMEVGFEHRSPRPDDVIRIGMVDLDGGDKWIELGQSTAWCWQQGCMLQWIPNSKTNTKILWNDREGDKYVCRIFDVKTKVSRTIPHPVYTLSADGVTAVSADFRRINDMRPGYGYTGLADPYADQFTPTDSGIYRVSLETGQQELIISIADVANLGPLRDDMKDAKHYFNHLLFNTDGSRFVFLHRWRPKGWTRRFRTRMLTATPEGKDIYVLDPSGHTSHFIWQDPDHVLAWTRPAGKDAGFWLFKDQTNQLDLVGEGVLTPNGHCTYLPGNQWILSDTYPDDNRHQNPYLYHVKTGRKVSLGHFHLPKAYTGEWRCDTHPRFSPDGRLVVIDSPHTGEGRQLHLIDVGIMVA